MNHRWCRRSARPSRLLLAVALIVSGVSGCAIGPRALEDERLRYNEVIKATTEQQLLLNIVRLRYTDTPSSIAVSAIALQTEAVKGFQIIPFFGVSGTADARGLTAILPQGQASIADRPTITLTPQDDQEFTRKLFTPMSLEGVLYLAKTTWPIATVFRLWLENLNWVSNAQTASGPTPIDSPEYERFLDGIQSLQLLQDRSQVVFTNEEREEPVGPPIDAARVSGRDLLEATKEGLSYRAGETATASGQWTLIRKRQQPVLRIHPRAIGSIPLQRFTDAFRLMPSKLKYEISIERLDPFPENYPAEGVDALDLETRSLLQVLYFVSKGVSVPDEHVRAGIARQTRSESGAPFDWAGVLRGLFSVASSAGESAPAEAHAAIRYRDHWFYIDRRDHDSLSTFSLLMELARLELAGKTSSGPALTLPLGGR
jgi:hypothetical protein